MRKQLLTAFLFTIVTTVLLGIVYPLGITLVAHVFMRDYADGELIRQNGVVVGSRLIGQSFSGPEYFHGRPSNAGTGYDAANSSGSNLGPTNAALIARVEASVRSFQTSRPGVDVPVDLVTASGSGLDPDITPASAQYQMARVASARGMNIDQMASLVQAHTQQRQFGILGEPRVNVLELNLALNAMTASVKPNR